jgi:hypothetical protein
MLTSISLFKFFVLNECIKTANKLNFNEENKSKIKNDQFSTSKYFIMIKILQTVEFEQEKLMSIIKFNLRCSYIRNDFDDEQVKFTMVCIMLIWIIRN